MQSEYVARLGDYVMVSTLGNKGYVVGIDKEGEMCEVRIGNIRTRIDRRHIEKVAIDRKPSLEKEVQVQARPVEGSELNLIGMRVEDAMRELDTFIDRAILQGMSRVRILHGIGPGRLMSAVKEHLHGVEYIKDLKKDERNAGVTVVELL